MISLSGECFVNIALAVFFCGFWYLQVSFFVFWTSHWLGLCTSAVASNNSYNMASPIRSLFARLARVARKKGGKKNVDYGALRLLRSCLRRLATVGNGREQNYSLLDSHIVII